MTRDPNQPEGQAAFKILDNHIENVTGPLLNPILDMYRQEGAPFISGYNKETPFSDKAQDFVASGIRDKYPFVHYDVKDYSAFEFENDVPKIFNSTPMANPIGSTFSMTKYLWETDDKIDAASYYAAEEMAIKMVSTKTLYDFFGAKAQFVNETTCREIN